MHSPIHLILSATKTIVPFRRIGLWALASLIAQDASEIGLVDSFIGNLKTCGPKWQGAKSPGRVHCQNRCPSIPLSVWGITCMFILRRSD